MIGPRGGSYSGEGKEQKGGTGIGREYVRIWGREGERTGIKREDCRISHEKGKKKQMGGGKHGVK